MRSGELKIKDHIYIIDDEEIVRESTVFFLTAAGFSAESFASGQGFLSGIEERRAGCILLDIRMPEMDGLQFIKALGGRITTFPILVITGHGNVATAVSALKLGASDFLEKPYTEDALLAALDVMFTTMAESGPTAKQIPIPNAKIGRLTRREQDILRGLIAGLSNKEMGFQLQLSVRTVEMHRFRMMDRLGARTLSEALTIAFQAGFV